MASKKKTETMPSSEAERGKALEAAIKKIEKDFGKGAIMRMGDDGNANVAVIPSGILTLDIALGIGGVPRGRVLEIYGPESSGKTTVALHMVAAAQQNGGNAAFVDAEHALDPSYAERLGVDIDNLLVSQPDNGEQGLEITEALVRSGAVDIVVVDSVAALTPRAEIDGEMGDSVMGLQARLMSQALRKLTSIISKSRTTVIFINQLREKIGVMFGSPETTPGGRAMKFYSSIRLDVRRGERIMAEGEQIGNATRVKVVKNKLAPPFKEARFDLIYGKGASNLGCVLDVAADLDIVQKAGAWYSYGDDRLGQGRDNSIAFLEENPALVREIENKVREHYGLDSTATIVPEAVEQVEEPEEDVPDLLEDLLGLDELDD